MNVSSTAPLKWSAVVFAVLWAGSVLWWTGSYEPAGIFILASCGAIVGCGWYFAMRFMFRRSGLLPDHRREDTSEVLRGAAYRWMVWTGAMALTGILTIWLLDLVEPHIPTGNGHQLIKSLFVILVWPALMWSLRPLIQRHLPQPTLWN